MTHVYHVHTRCNVQTCRQGPAGNMQKRKQLRGGAYSAPLHVGAWGPGRAEKHGWDANTGPQFQGACCLSPTCSLPACEANAPEIPTSREKVPLRYGLDSRFQVPPQFPTVTRWGCGCVQVPPSSLPHLGVPTWTSCGVFWKDCNAFCVLRTSSYDPLRVLLIAY